MAPFQPALQRLLPSVAHVSDGGGAPSSTAGPQHADAGLAAVCGERAKAGWLTKPAPKIRLTRRIARRY